MGHHSGQFQSMTVLSLKVQNQDFLGGLFQGDRGAILTTHSMEEADALCSRVGIMVKGELR